METPRRRSGIANLLTVTEKRDDFLRALVETEQRKRDLAETFDCSRSTVDRAIADLKSSGLAEREDGHWKPTLLGVHVCRVRNQYRDRLETLVESEPLLDALPADDRFLCDFLDDATVHLGDPLAPDAVLTPFLRSISRATSVRISTPVVMTGFVEEFLDGATSGETYEVEVVVPKNVATRIASRYPDLVERVREDDDQSVHVAPIETEFGIWLADDEVGLIVFTKNGISGVVVNDSADSLDWARETYAAMKSCDGSCDT